MSAKAENKKEEKSEAERQEIKNEELLEERRRLLKGKISFEEKKRINEIEKKLGLQRKERMSSAFVRDNLLED